MIVGAEGWRNQSFRKRIKVHMLNGNVHYTGYVPRQDLESLYRNVLCGDFNDTPESRVCRRLNETFHDTWALVNLGDGFTIPAANPRKRIDYIWISKDKSLVPLKVRVPQSDASDHLPVLAEFELR